MCNSISDIQHLITTQAVPAIPWRIMPLISEIPISSPVTKCQFIGIVSNLQPVRILMNISQKLSQSSIILNDHITITSKTDWHYNSFDDLYLTEDNVFSWSCFSLPRIMFKLCVGKLLSRSSFGFFLDNKVWIKGSGSGPAKDKLSALLCWRSWLI